MSHLRYRGHPIGKTGHQPSTLLMAILACVPLFLCSCHRNATPPAEKVKEKTNPAPGRFLGEPDALTTFRTFGDVREYLEDETFVSGGKSVKLSSEGYCELDGKKMEAELVVTKFQENTADVVAVCHEGGGEHKYRFTVDAVKGTLEGNGTTYTLKAPTESTSTSHDSHQ